MENLADKKCRACELGEGKLNPADVEALLTHVPDWKATENLSISRHFKFKNFKEALAFVNKIGAIAESEGHHPDSLGNPRFSNARRFTAFLHGKTRVFPTPFLSV
jgi:4a-hydroxytetrahydrobiopterin dehydratase